MEALLLAARLILAAVFLVSGIAKLFDLSGSQAAMRSFGVPESLSRPGGILLPIVELAIAVLLLPVETARWGALLALILLVVFIAGVGYNLSRGRKFDCHCFGQLTTSEIGPSTLVRNAVLAVVAAFIAIPGFANNNVGPSIGDAFGGLSAFEWVMLVVGVILIAGLAGVSWLLVHLLGQNGRLLVRLDAIEAALEDADISLEGDEDEDEDEEDEEEEEEGLPYGAPAPAFTLSGLYGETMTLDALRAQEKPVLLIFSDPGCGPCNAMMADVGKWQHDHVDKLTTVLVSRGSPEENRKKQKQHNLTHVLLQKDSEVADAYLTYGTPTAVLVKPDGTIGSAAAGGADEIRTLVKQAVAGKVPVPAPRPTPIRPPQPAAAPAPRGLANIGKDAPVVELTNLDGEPVKLTDFAGQSTAVLFWNPGCGFCQRMAEDLKAWETNPPKDAPKLLIVSTGDVEANRKVGLTSPMVLDTGFSVGRAFGASGTPSAVLVGADGKIASGLAVGGPTVISLLRNEAPNLLDASAAAAAAEEPAAPPPPRGVAIGGKAPAVELPDLEGNVVKLDETRNGRTALLFWNPGCGFCKRLEPELKEWEASRGEGAPQLVLVSTGSADANRAHGFASTILLDQGFRTGGAFGASGTPSAVMIDKDGNVASGVAVGGPDVMKLLRS
jgi:peroxiredoxin